MSPLLPRPGHRLLQCPVCRLDLIAAGNTLACRNRHSFDLAREGYVNLLRRKGRQPASGGDTLEQLRHRATFLDAGHFDPIAMTIAEHVRQKETKLGRILDAGSGTGHHLANIAKALSPDVVGLGLDISPGAARQATRRWPTLAFAVTDLWTEWPVQDGAVDLLISIFAPKNFPETARVLRRAGWLAVALHETAARRYTEAVNRFIGPPTVRRLRWQTFLDDAAIRSAILMGPNAHHVAISRLDGELGPMAVTFEFMVLLARRNESLQGGVR